MFKTFFTFLFVLLNAPALWAAPSCVSFLETEAAYFLYKKTTSGFEAYDGMRKVGYIKFAYTKEEKILHIESIEIKEKYRGMRISKFFLKKALAAYPQADFIESILVGTNQDIYVKEKRALVAAKNERRASYEDGLEAVKKTPAYRIRSALGFSKIEVYTREETSISLTVSRDQKKTRPPGKR